jgi:hypothetical protein
MEALSIHLAFKINAGKISSEADAKKPGKRGINFLCLLINQLVLFYKDGEFWEKIQLEGKLQSSSKDEKQVLREARQYITKMFKEGEHLNNVLKWGKRTSV